MKIAMINGSPKLGLSNSELMLQIFEKFINKEHEITHYNINKASLNNEQCNELCQNNVWVFAFPLYIDAIPSHLFKLMIRLEQQLKSEKNNNIYVYAIINNGFYEGHQNSVAVEILENWCIRAGIHFGMAICQGAGEMMGSVKNVPIGHGPLKNLGKAMENLAYNMEQRKVGQNEFFSPNFPKFAWKFMATHGFWNQTAKKNGLKLKDVTKKIGG